MRPLKNLVKNIAKESIRKKGFATAQIIFDWNLIIGDELAKYTTPLKVHYPTGKTAGGTLHIEVEHAQALHVQQLEPLIIEKIATYFGFRAVDKLKLIHVNTHRKPVKEIRADIPAAEIENLDKLTDGIEDSELRERIKSIGNNILQRKYEQQK